MELSSFHPEVLLASSQGHSVWPSDEGQGKEMPEDTGTVCKLVCSACQPRAQPAYGCETGLKQQQGGASPGEKWSFGQRKASSLETRFIFHIHIQHWS